MQRKGVVMKRNLTTKILWAVYIGLLAVLLPHTAWLFTRFEPDSSIGTVAAWAGAFAFEAAIAVLTHKLAKHIEDQPRKLKPWAKFTYRYLNAYSFGLVVSVLVSALANLAHSVEFGRSLTIFAQWGIPAQVYQIAFGGVLPVVSLLFARVLSNVSESEDEVDPDMEEAKSTIEELRRDLRVSDKRAREAELRFAAAGDLFVRLTADEKRQRILAARERWPALPASSVAIITECSPSYVSEVINADA